MIRGKYKGPPPACFVPDCDYYCGVVLPIRAKPRVFHWCRLCNAACGLFPPHIPSPEWQPECWEVKVDE
jgi:hypothetical protein